MAVRRRHSPEADWEEVLFFFDQLFINPGFTRGHLRAMNLVWSETLKSGVKKKTSVTRDEELVEKKQYGGGAPLVCPGSEPFQVNLALSTPRINLGVGSRARVTRMSSVIPSQIREQLDQGDSYSSRLL
jgi:hypothetical protein